MGLLSLLILLSAALHIRAEYWGPRTQVYLFKPLTTTLIFLLALSLGGSVPLLKWGIVVGLVFSLAGDIFLMLPQNRFIAGLASFLVAHLCYIVAFAADGGPFLALSPLVPLLLVGIICGWILWPHLGRLRLPVFFYLAIILVMAWQAAGRWLSMPSPAALAGMVGALLFVVSDATLAFNRFVRRFRPAQAIILSTYFLAQWLIANSIGR